MPYAHCCHHKTQLRAKPSNDSQKSTNGYKNYISLKTSISCFGQTVSDWYEVEAQYCNKCMDTIKWQSIAQLFNSFPTRAAEFARLWAALSCACRCGGGCKYRHCSREHRPLTKSIQTVTTPSLASICTCSGGCANRHSDSGRLQLPRWYSRQTYTDSNVI